MKSQIPLKKKMGVLAVLVKFKDYMVVNKDKEQALDHSEVLKILNYDPITGVFIWRVTRGCAKARSVA